MEFKTYYKNQRDLALAINSIIDCYWNDELEEIEMISTIKRIFNNNSNKIFKNGIYTKILIQQCGKKRVEILNNVLVNEGKI